MMFPAATRLVRKVAEVCDVGPGIRPMGIFKPAKHICIEPHGEYADVLEGHGMEILRTDALTGLAQIPPVDSVFFLDVIEHMEKDEGQRALKLALEKAREQVVVFTPLGYFPQEFKEGQKDAWGYHGAHWQTHRSGWVPEDFDASWKVVVDEEFHGHKDGALYGALCAVHG